MGKLQIDTDMFIYALEVHSYDIRYSLDIKTGEVVSLMERFDVQLLEGKIKNELIDALGHRKSFRRFKDILVNDPEVRERWFVFHNQELKKIAQEWLEDNNIDAELLLLSEERRSEGM